MVIDKCCQDGRRVKKNVNWGNQQVDNGVSWELLLASDVWSAVTIPWAVCQQIHCFFSLTSKFLETNQQTFVVFLYWFHVITVVSPKKIMMYTYIIYIYTYHMRIYICLYNFRRADTISHQIVQQKSADSFRSTARYLHQWFLTLFINCFPISMVKASEAKS